MILQLAWRNLWRNRRRTILTALTVALGLTLMLIFIGLGDGSHRQMIESAVRTGSGHVVVQAAGYQQRGGLERTLSAEEAERAVAWLRGQRQSFEILQVTRRIFLSALASSADGSTGIQLMGVEPGLESATSRFAEKISEGEFLLPDDDDMVVLGQGVARKLEVSLGDKVVLMAQGASGDIESTLVRVRGILRTAQDELDQVVALVPLHTAQQFLQLTGRVHQVAVLLDGPDDSGRLAAAGQAEFPDLEVLDWSRALPELADFIRIDDGGNYVFHTFLFLLVAFMVLNSLLMSVLERTREFTLLEALGLTGFQRFQLVIFEAALLGGLSLAGGFVVGFSVHLYLAVYGLPTDIFNMGEGVSAAGVAFDPVFYSHLSSPRIAEVMAVVFALVLVLGLLPARRAARRGDIGMLGSR